MEERKKGIISLLFFIWIVLCALLFAGKRISDHYLWKEWMDRIPIQEDMLRENWMEGLWNMEYSLMPGIAYEERASDGFVFLQSLCRCIEKELFPIQKYLVDYWDGSDDFEKFYADWIPEAFRESDEGKVKEETNKAETIDENEDGKVYTFQQLKDASFLLQHFYTVDESTSMTSKNMDVEKYLKKDLSVDRFGEEPLILIYHTHGSETYRKEKGEEGNVIQVGETLKETLEKKYRINAVHDKTVYDMVDGELDRNAAYNYAGKSVEKYIKKHPSVRVVLDIHRDSVGESVHLRMKHKDKNCAQIMFFNGISRDKYGIERKGLPNSNLDTNLAMSLQMQLMAAKYFPGFTRRIYIKGYRYNLHLMPRSMLIEVGAQNNTLKEAQNSMELLAELLYRVLSGEKAYNLPME